MKLKKLLILIGAVIILFMFVPVKGCLQKSRLSEMKNKDSAALLLISGDPEAFASKVTIYRGGSENDKIILSRQNDGQWIVETKYGVKARQDKVDNLLNSFKDLRGELRGESKSLFADFEILDNQSGHIILEGNKGNTLAHLVVSFKKPAFNQYFVRLAGSEKVILTERNILSASGIFDKTTPLNAGLFADYKIFSFDPASVNKITLTNSRKKALILVKEVSSKDKPEGVWRFEMPKTRKPLQPDPLKVNEFLQNASAIRALDSLDPALAAYGFDRPFTEATLDFSKDSKTPQIRILIGAHLKDRGGYYARIMPQNQVFFLSEPFVNNLNRDKTYFSVQKNKGKKG